MNLRFYTLIILLVLFSSTYSVKDPTLTQSGQIGLKECLSARTLGATHLSLFLQIDFSSDKNLIEKVYEQKEKSNKLDSLFPRLTLLSFRPVVSFGVTHFIDLSAGLPIFFDIMDHFSPEGGLGDLEFNAKIRVPLKEANVFQTALLTSISFPTGHSNAGYTPRFPWNFKTDDKDSLVTHNVFANYGNGKPESSLLALFSLQLSKFLFHVNSGVRLTFHPDVDELFILNGGVEFIPSANVTLFCDIGSMTQFHNVNNGINKDHLRIAPGITLRTEKGALVTFSADFKLSSNQQKIYYDIDNKPRRVFSENEPLWKITIQTGWNRFLKSQDKDNDLVPDVDDKCPDVKEDIDGFEDADGCIDSDNDNDGVPDLTDKCRDIPEDLDGVDDLDGCPDFDNDKDNVVDSLDKCSEPEDIDGYDDFDGCPDYDNDSDSVPDTLDKCMMIPEDIDSFQDDDGCPDLDNDMDGVPDSVDQCPDEAGSVKLNGCKRSQQPAKEIKFGRVILKNVEFGSGSVQLSESAFNVLDQVVASLNASPQIILEIQVHTDNSGDQQANIRLSQKRAEIICDYLISKGIQQDRLMPIGKGSAEPIAKNETVKGRKLNTRVEIHRKK